ncbi:bacteriohemerythrin [Azospirillum sp. sgz302134]
MTTDGHTVPRTGNSFIDVTHAALMDRVGTIRRECATGAPRDEVVPHFCDFVNEMRAHFDHEEVIIRAVGYRRWEEHAHQHEMLDQQLGRLIDYVRECDVTNDFMCTVAGTLDAALCRHEIRHDSEYAALVRNASTPAPGPDLILWDPSFDIGIAALDAQHRQLVECLNEIDRISRGNGSVAEGLELLELMQDHVQAHFAMEEGMLRTQLPSRFLGHSAHHKVLVAQFARIRAEIEAGRVDLGVAARDFFRFWLMDHVLGSDRPTFAAAREAPGR